MTVFSALDNNKVVYPLHIFHSQQFVLPNHSYTNWKVILMFDQSLGSGLSKTNSQHLHICVIIQESWWHSRKTKLDLKQNTELKIWYLQSEDCKICMKLTVAEGYMCQKVYYIYIYIFIYGDKVENFINDAFYWRTYALFGFPRLKWKCLGISGDGCESWIKLIALVYFFN